MKRIYLIAIGLLSTCLATCLGAQPLDLENIDPDKARAYEAYVMTFVWPEQMSSEEIEYDNVLSLDGIPKFDEDNTNTTEQTREDSPFAKFQHTIARHTHLLTNHQWTLIFPDKGATLSETFHSNKLEHGYSEFTGSVRFTLGRYIESKLDYQHYRFNHQVDTTNLSNYYFTPFPEDNLLGSSALMSQPLAGPSDVLKLNFTNKTASKKLNYLDHPIIGTLIYFEPLELEQAIERITAR